METPLISVILPIYNVQSYLPRCMDSLFRQTYYNLELIMVDDGSDQACAELCDEYLKMDDRVVVYHKKNGGLSDARNYGIACAKGEFITCIDPDDYVDCDYVEYLYKLVKKYNSKMSIVQHRVRFNSGRIRDNGTSGDEKLEIKKCLERMLYHNIIDTSAWGKLYHRSLFESVEYPKGKIFEDIGTTYKLMMQCEYIAVGYESKYNYIFHENSIVNGKFKLAKLDLLEMTDRMAADVVQQYPELKRATLRRQVYSRFSTLNQMLNIDGHEEIKEKIITYIKKNRWEIIKNPLAPKRDKLAIILLTINYKVYRFVWLKYMRTFMKREA